MVRYFFDVKFQASVEHDYSGRFLLTLEGAKQMAELIAMDLGCTRIEGAFPIEVQIRDAGGRELFSIPVTQIDALAA
jgi:hypothetical protein